MTSDDTIIEPEHTLDDLLKRIQLFSMLSDQHIARLRAIGAEEQHDSGVKLFAEGEVGEKFYLILEGKIRISRVVPSAGEEALAVLERGDYFGEMALIDDAPRSADAITHEDCLLFVLTKDDLENLLFVDRGLAYDLLWSFVRTLAARLRSTNDKIAFLTLAGRFG